MPLTPRLKLPYPALTDPADAPHDLGALATALDPGAGLPAAAMDSQGLLGQLPAPGSPGRYYWATDQGTLYRDDGTAWRIVGPQPGDLKAGAGPAGGLGWLLCDGSTILRTGVNAPLFATIGIAWGAGDGSTTFALPDLRSRHVVGAGQAPGLSARALGGRGGEEAHQLSAAEMPSHAHAVSDPTHAHSLADPGHAHATYGRGDINTGNTGNWIAVAAWAAGGGGTGASGTGQGVYGSATGIGIYGAGGDAGHNNMPPWAAANQFVKL